MKCPLPLLVLTHYRSLVFLPIDSVCCKRRKREKILWGLQSFGVHLLDGLSSNGLSGNSIIPKNASHWIENFLKFKIQIILFYTRHSNLLYITFFHLESIISNIDINFNVLLCYPFLVCLPVRQQSCHAELYEERYRVRLLSRAFWIVGNCHQSILIGRDTVRCKYRVQSLSPNRWWCSFVSLFFVAWIFWDDQQQRKFVYLSSIPLSYTLCHNISIATQSVLSSS